MLDRRFPAGQSRAPLVSSGPRHGDYHRADVGEFAD
jgi:hypothetical protein